MFCTTAQGGFRYWRNLGHGTLDRPRTLPQMPAGVSLDHKGVGFGDVSGNGVADLLVDVGPLAGFFETTLDGAWERFTPFETSPGSIRQDAAVRMVDLTGDGRSDASMTAATTSSCGSPVWASRASRRRGRSPAATTRTSSPTCSSTIRPTGSAWPT